MSGSHVQCVQIGDEEWQTWTSGETPTDIHIAFSLTSEPIQAQPHGSFSPEINLSYSLMNHSFIYCAIKHYLIYTLNSYISTKTTHRILKCWQLLS